jgi:hypothetical protein
MLFSSYFEFYTFFICFVKRTVSARQKYKNANAMDAWKEFFWKNKRSLIPLFPRCSGQALIKSGAKIKAVPRYVEMLTHTS